MSEHVFVADAGPKPEQQAEMQIEWDKVMAETKIEKQILLNVVRRKWR